jgi:hypothetical protein
VSCGRNSNTCRAQSERERKEKRKKTKSERGDEIVEPFCRL